jgi:uncharacterized protein YecE (DUF72 family)
VLTLQTLCDTVISLLSQLPPSFATPPQELKKMEDLRDHPNPQNDVVEADDDDPPMLSSETLSALKEFLAQQNRSLGVEPDPDNVENGEEEVALVAEDWRLSQFWYDRETAETVAREVLTLCQPSDSRVACIACPTLYAYLKVLEFGA